MNPNPKRREPRTMAAVLGDVTRELAPNDPLSRVQSAWPQLVGKRAAEVSEPIRMQGDGTIVVRCSTGAAASELALREPEILALMADVLELTCGLRIQGPAGTGRRPRRGG